jgi:DNA-binding NtrC family response regulator
MRVLVIDDDDSLRAMICELLIEIGYELVGFASLDEVADNASFRIGRGDLIVIDIDARRADELRAPVAAAFPQAVVITAGEGEYESIPRAHGRERRERARAPQRRARSERVVVAS